VKGKSGFSRELPTLALVLIALAALTAFVPAFHGSGNLTGVACGAAYIGIMACGEGMVILGGGLDLSVGSVLALSSCFAAMAMAAGLPWPIAIVVALAIGAAAGVINGALITYGKLPPILTTLATLLIFRHGTSVLTHAHTYRPFPPTFDLMGTGWNPAILFLGVVIVASVVMLLTRFGRRLLAIGGSEQSALLSGVPVARVKLGAYVASGGTAAIAGLILMAFNNNTQSTIGFGYELDAIAACVVGGIRMTGGDGSIIGAALGAVLMALLRNWLQLTGKPEEMYGLYTGAIILVAAVLEQWRLRSLDRAALTAGGAK
jgi:ribose transport system permease protein